MRLRIDDAKVFSVGPEPWQTWEATAPTPNAMCRRIVSLVRVKVRMRTAVRSFAVDRGWLRRGRYDL